jgi:endonuclease YncB( thermonuclease family)
MTKQTRYSMIVTFVLFVSVAAFAVDTTPWAGVCSEVLDGDTIKVDHDGQQVTVRLYGVDCPESGQAFGGQATKLTSDACLNQ